MTHPGSFGGFPGDWTYYGDAQLLLKDTVQLITVSLRLIFIEEAEIDVKIIWNSVTDDDRLKIAIKMDNEKQQIIVIQHSIFLTGCSVAPSYTNDGGTTNFDVERIVSYSGRPENILTDETPDEFIQLRAYLNDEFSSYDDLLAIEFENMPRKRSKKTGWVMNEPSLYCALTSGYQVKCGKKYITHKDHNIFYKKNIDTLYKLSFIDIIVPLNNQHINNLITHEVQEIEICLARHLENVLNDACAFLSIVCDYEILPIYYDYLICSQNKYINGRIIPIWERRRIPRISHSWPKMGVNFLSNITAFLECCPLNKKLSRGIQHLKITVYESTVELKLMASCSAIEYFYSYWFWEMNGISNLRSADLQKNTLILKNFTTKKLNNYKTSSHGTPPLSNIIRFLLDDLGIDWKKYMNSEDKPQFIQIRNKLLHGSFTSDDVEIFKAQEVAQKLGTEILFSIMKKISLVNDSSLYDQLPIRTPEKDFYTLSDGWLEIKDILDELDSKEDCKRFWNQDYQDYSKRF